MALITEWLKPFATYNHKTQGKKNNRKFCEEVAEHINKNNPSRKAKIVGNIIKGENHIAVFTERIEKNGS